MLKNNGVKPTSLGAYHWLEFMPGYVYCFLPSLNDMSGKIHVYTSMPDFVKDFDFCMPIEKV